MAPSHVGGSSDQDTVTVYFVDEDVAVEAFPGENLLEVSLKCGVGITTGCLSGSCGSCEMEMKKVLVDGLQPETARVVRTCIGVVPRGVKRIEISTIQDPIWGADQWI